MCEILNVTVSDVSTQCVITNIAGAPTGQLEALILYITSIILTVVMLLLLLQVMFVMAKLSRA